MYLDHDSDVAESDDTDKQQCLTLLTQQMCTGADTHPYAPVVLMTHSLTVQQLPSPPWAYHLPILNRLEHFDSVDKPRHADKLAAFCEHGSMNGDFCRLMQGQAIYYEMVAHCKFAVPQGMACHEALLLRSSASAAQDHLLHSPCNTHATGIPQTIKTMQE